MDVVESVFEKDFSLNGTRFRYSGPIIVTHDSNPNSERVLPHGKGGTAIYSAGDRYDGEWANGKREGRGILRSANGDLYDGEFKNDQREGSCKITYTTRGTYEGEYKNNMKNGLGLRHFPNGDVYKGEFKEDNFDGPGIFTVKQENKTYIVNFKHHKFHGEGLIITGDGQPFACRWNYDNLDYTYPSVMEVPYFIPLLTNSGFEASVLRWALQEGDQTLISAVLPLIDFQSFEPPEKGVFVIPRGVTQQGYHAVRDWLLKTTGEEMPHIKLLVLGNGRAGKTTLLRSLAALEQIQNESKMFFSRKSTLAPLEHTDSSFGLEAHENLKFNNSKIRFSVFDFAGQSEYLTCHSHYFSNSGAIYVIVVSCAQPKLQDIKSQLRFWLEYLEEELHRRSLPTLEPQAPPSPSPASPGQKYLSNSFSPKTFRSTTSSVQLTPYSSTSSITSVISSSPRLPRLPPQFRVVILGTQIDLLPPDICPDGLRFHLLEVAKEFQDTLNISDSQCLLISARIHQGTEIVQKLLVHLGKELTDQASVSRVPSAFLKAKQRLTQLATSHHILSYEAVKKELMEMMEKEQTILGCLEHFHNVGVITFFPLVGQVVLDSQKFAKAMAVFVDLRTTSQQRLLIPESEALEQMSRLGLRGPERTQTLAVFEHLGILFRLQMNTHPAYLIPSLLPQADILLLPRPASSSLPSCEEKVSNLQCMHLFRSDLKKKASIQVFQVLQKHLWPFRLTEYRVFRNAIYFDIKETIGVAIYYPDSTIKLILTNVNFDGKAKLGRLINDMNQRLGKEYLSHFFSSISGSIERDCNLLTVFRPSTQLHEKWLSTRATSGKDMLTEVLDASLVLSKPWDPVFGPDFVQNDNFVTHERGQVLKTIELFPNDTHPEKRAEFERVRHCFHRFLGQKLGDVDFKIEKIVFLHNPTLEKSFRWKYFQMVEKSLDGTAGYLEEQAWNPEKKRVLQELERYSDKLSGNQGVNLVMAWQSHLEANLYNNAIVGQYIPDPVSAEVIAKIDDGFPPGDFGWYGRGAYFTQHPFYASRYVKNKKVLQLSWVLLGRAYPVTEQPFGEGTRHGKSLVEGFDSHYVIINKDFTPCQKDEAIYQDEIVIFNKPQVLPRYMVYFSRAHKISEATSATPISDQRALQGDEVLPLNEGPVVIHVDPHPLDILNLIEIEPSIRISVFNFPSTMEALTYMHRHKDELISRKRENILRIITNRNRNNDDGGEQAGEELIRKLRADPDWRSVPMLIYCRQTHLVQLKPQQTPTIWFSVTGDAKVAFDFCTMKPLEGVPRHQWNILSGPLLILGIKNGQGFQQLHTFGGHRNIYCVVKFSDNEFYQTSAIASTDPHWDFMCSSTRFAQVGPNHSVVIEVYATSFFRDFLIGKLSVHVREQDFGWHSSPIVPETEDGSGSESLRFRIVWLAKESDQMLVKDFWGRAKPRLDTRKRIENITVDDEESRGSSQRNPFGFLNEKGEDEGEGIEAKEGVSLKSFSLTL